MARASIDLSHLVTILIIFFSLLGFMAGLQVQTQVATQFEAFAKLNSAVNSFIGQIIALAQNEDKTRGIITLLPGVGIVVVRCDTLDAINQNSMLTTLYKVFDMEKELPSDSVERASKANELMGLFKKECEYAESGQIICGFYIAKPHVSLPPRCVDVPRNMEIGIGSIFFIYPQDEASLIRGCAIAAQKEVVTETTESGGEKERIKVILTGDIEGEESVELSVCGTKEGV